ncbi:Immunoglobulin-binding protein 1, partial [Fasciolopsis buskii]
STPLGDLNSPAAKRDAKIKQYKEKKELEQRLETMATYIDQPHVDEEVKREYNLTLVRHWLYTVNEELNTLLQEEQFLSMDPEQLKPAEKTERQSTQHIKPFILTRDAAQAAVFGAGYPSLPTMTIDQLYEQEVKLGLIPPQPKSQTKMQEEGSSARVTRIDPSESEKEAAEKKAIENDALEDADDPDKLRESRNWDAFKDEHRRGSGNRMNRA